MRIHGTHAETFDRTMTGYVTDTFHPIPDHFGVVLGGLNGRDDFTYTMWRVTNPESSAVRARDRSELFIEASGSAGALVITVTLRCADGAVRLHVVGQPGTNDGGRIEVRVGDTAAVRVFSNEVFTADEAAAIFYTYYLTNAVAQPYQLRGSDPADTVRVAPLWSHAESFNGGEYGYLTGRGKPIAEHLSEILHQADGKRRYTYSIWRMTNPDDLRDHDGYFIQAGGSEDQMTIEFAVPAADGSGRLFTLGHRDSPDSGPTVLIPINSKRAVRVFSNEVFTADEAAAIFDTYYRTGEVPDAYSRRELDLSTELSEPRGLPDQAP
ncbi:hypothetical protein [Microbacterium mangrovi]|uniref:hypothetical protein n=1 Tax=Microbacterium mangrovi TaxID=1348253 RepID=UPI00068C7A79|nr:hypothetical protein [Microbacterium mangrovi]